MRMGCSAWKDKGESYREAVRTGQRERETAFCITGLETGSLKFCSLACEKMRAMLALHMHK